MPRYKRFTFLCDEQDRRLLDQISNKLNRSQSEVVRQLIHKAAGDLLPPMFESVPVKFVHPVLRAVMDVDHAPAS